jgi:hypothetical protein
MKLGGPLAPESDHGVKEVRDTLKRADRLLLLSAGLSLTPIPTEQRLQVAPTPCSSPSSMLEQKQNDSRVR